MSAAEDPVLRPHLRERLEGFFDSRRAGEGFDEGCQSVPANWGMSSARKRGFFDLVASLSGLEAVRGE